MTSLHGRTLIGMSAHRSHDRPRKLPRCPRSGRCPLLARTRVKDPRGLQAGLEPGPGSVSPCAAVGARCAYRGGGGKGEHGMGLGNGGSDASSGLAVSAAEQLMRLRGKFLSAAEVLWSGHWCSIRLAVRYWTDYRAGSPANSVRRHATLIVISRPECHCQVHPALGPRAGLLTEDHVAPLPDVYDCSPSRTGSEVLAHDRRRGAERDPPNDRGLSPR